MRYSCRSSVEYDLQLHYELRTQYERELSDRSEYAGCLLKQKKGRNGTCYYSIRYPNETSHKYIGFRPNEDVTKVREYSYYKKAISVIESNIRTMEQFLSIYQNTGASDINELLKSAYRLPADSHNLILEPEISEWYRSSEAIKNSYPLFDPAGLTVTAFDGTLMRSRAEAAHYEGFYIYNIPAVYELPYKIDGEILRPDFTVLDVYLFQPKMWEHLGNWFHDNQYKRERYREDALHRWDQYASVGYYPENNLILTFGASGNIFDIQDLHRKIAMLAVPPPSKETIEMLKRS